MFQVWREKMKVNYTLLIVVFWLRLSLEGRTEDNKLFGTLSVYKVSQRHHKSYGDTLPHFLLSYESNQSVVIVIGEIHGQTKKQCEEPNALCCKSNGRCDINAEKREELESKSSHKSDIWLWPPAASKKWGEIYWKYIFQTLEAIFRVRGWDPFCPWQTSPSKNVSPYCIVQWRLLQGC